MAIEPAPSRLIRASCYLPALVFATAPVVNGADLYQRFTPIQPFPFLRAMAVAAGLALAAALVLWALPGRDRIKGAALAVAVLVVGAYPTFARWLHVRPYGTADLLTAGALVAALAVGLLLLARRVPAALVSASPVLALMAALFALYAAWFGITATSRPTASGISLRHAGGEPVVLRSGAPAPDIVHVIFDGLGRLDYLERDFGIASAPARTALNNRGIAISERAVANYSQTYLSVAAMLSMGYLDDVASRAGSRHDRAAVEQVIDESTVIRALTARGYQFTLLSSGYEVLEHHPAALDGVFGPTWFGEFESYVFRRSPIRMLPVGPLTFLPHRARTRELLASLEDFQPGPRPRYVLAHVLVPHPPFVFDASGQPQTPPGLFTVADGNGFAGSRDEYRAGYAAQARFALATIEHLAERLGRLPRPPILIVNGDHGSGLGYNQVSPLDGETAGRMAPFIAVAGPVNRSSLPGSPVNIYRWLFSTVFDAGLPMVPDRSFVSAFTDPYAFHEVRVPAASTP